MRILLMVGAAALLAACDSGPPGEAAVEPAQADAGMATPETAAPAPASAAPKAPAGAAKAIAYGVAAYPGARQLGDSPDFLLKEGKNPRWLQYETVDAPAKVIEFYKAEAAKAGFAIIDEKDRKLARSMELKTVRPGGGVMNVTTLAQADGKTMINLHISQDS